MNRTFAIAALALLGCTAMTQPVPSLSPTRASATPPAEAAESAAELDALMALAEERAAEAAQPAAAPTSTRIPPRADETVLDGNMVQGGLVRGTTAIGTQVMLDDINVPVDRRGNFVFGFDRDHGPTATLTITRPDGTRDSRTLAISKRNWKESRITVAEDKANPYKQADLDKIAADTALKQAARAKPVRDALWVTGFAWPADGCISSPFGYRRIVNGEARRHHSGVDVAAPDGINPQAYIGEEVRAPASGQVTLAQPDMFFEGGLIFIDHGQGLESALMHLSKVDAKVGDFVEKGDKVGAVGMTGRVTGPHLHWTLKWRDRQLDPELVVDPRAECTD